MKTNNVLWPLRILYLKIKPSSETKKKFDLNKSLFKHYKLKIKFESLDKLLIIEFFLTIKFFKRNSVQKFLSGKCLG